MDWLRARLVQMEERQLCNLEVAGSIPSTGHHPLPYQGDYRRARRASLTWRDRVQRDRE